MPKERIWRIVIVANLVVTILLALWVVLFATGTDSLLPPALDPNAEVRKAVNGLQEDSNKAYDPVGIYP